MTKYVLAALFVLALAVPSFGQFIYPAPVYVAPAPVYCAPPVYHHPPVYYYRPPVYYPAPVYAAPAYVPAYPRYSFGFNFAFGRVGHSGHHHR